MPDSRIFWDLPPGLSKFFNRYPWIPALDGDRTGQFDRKSKAYAWAFCRWDSDNCDLTDSYIALPGRSSIPGIPDAIACCTAKRATLMRGIVWDGSAS